MSEAQNPQVLIEKALAGDPVSVKALVERLSPVIAKRVAATLWRRTGKSNVAQAAADMVQDVFLALFQADGKALRAWHPDRGMSLDSFIGLLAEHQVVSLLRTRRTSPWCEEPTEMSDFEKLAVESSTPEKIVASREAVRGLMDRLRETLSPRGLELFQRIIVDEEPLDRLMTTTGLTRDAIYQWKSRLIRTVRALSDEIGTSLSENPASLRMVKGAP